MFAKNSYTLNIYQFQNFIDLAQQSQDPLGLAKNYVQDTEQLIELMEEIRSATPNRSGKSRLTRLINKIQQQLQDEEEN